MSKKRHQECNPDAYTGKRKMLNSAANGDLEPGAYLYFIGT